MTYLSQSQLADDTNFQARVRAAITMQAALFLIEASTPPQLEYVAAAQALLRDDPAQINVTFIRLMAAYGSFPTEVDLGTGQIDSSRIADSDIVNGIANLFPTVAALFFDPSGNPIPGTST